MLTMPMSTILIMKISQWSMMTGFLNRLFRGAMKKTISAPIRITPLALINAEVIFHPEYSAGGMRRGKIRNVTYRNIHLFGNQQPAIGLYGFDRKHLCKNIVIKDLYWNNQKINQVKFILFQQNEFLRKCDIRIKHLK